ncbi:MAG: hypothetical protein K6E98_03785 [Lachnospiraceae bacterium]|nr:hypothetical protein [Lachnospiraceae bacterium]
MIYFRLSSSLQLQYDGALRKLKGTFVSKEVYLLSNDELTALGRPYSLVISLKDASLSETKSYERWEGIEEILNEDIPAIKEGTLMGEFMRFLLMRLRRVLKLEPYADEYMLSVLEGKLNERVKYYDIYIDKDSSEMTSIRYKGNDTDIETVLKIISEPSDAEEALKDIDLMYASRLMGLNRYEEALKLFKEALSSVSGDSMMATEFNLKLGEIYFFLEDKEAAIKSYKLCDKCYIKDIKDYYIRVGHLLLDDKEENGLKLREYYKGILNPTYGKYKGDEYKDIVAYAKPLYPEYEEKCLAAGKAEVG